MERKTGTGIYLINMFLLRWKTGKGASHTVITLYEAAHSTHHATVLNFFCAKVK